MRPLQFLYSTACFLSLGEVAFGAAGIVVLEDSANCSNFVVGTTNGYALLEWFGGVVVIFKNDQVSGDFEGYGMKNVHIEGRGDMRVWVEDYWVDEQDALEYFEEKCR